MRPKRTSPGSLARGSALVAVVGLLICVPPGSATGATSSNDNGTVALLVKSKVALTPDVVSAISSHASRVTYVWPEINAMALTATPAKMADLVADPNVASVEPDSQGSALTEDQDSLNGASEPTSVVVPIFTSSSPLETWNLDMADTAGSGYDGTGVTVAVVDSGLPQNWSDFLPPGSVDLTHAAGFGSEGVGDFHNPVNAIRGVGGHIGLFPHGLAVSSVIVGFPSDFGPVNGAAPGAKILPIRVLDKFNFGWASWFTAGILHVARLKGDGVLTGPVVINFSIQQRFQQPQVEADAISFAIARGVLFVTIAGNFGPSAESISFPGKLPQSITAGATGWVGEGSFSEWFFGDVPENNSSQVYVAGFSGRESSPPPSPTRIDVLAPGSFVFGEWLSGPGFSEGREVAFDAVSNFIFGTSFAAPHVAGIVAQMLQKNPGLSQVMAESILRSTALAIPAGASGCTPLSCHPSWGANATGAGLVRGTAAVAATP